MPRCFSNVLRFNASQLVFRYRANSEVNELLVLCRPFSIADKIFCVLRSERKVCTSIGGGCKTCVEGTGACKCKEEIDFEVSEGFNPDDARRKFLEYKYNKKNGRDYACCMFSLPAPPALRLMSLALSLIIPRLNSSLGSSALPARIVSFSF